MAKAKHKFQRLVFNPANQSLIDFLDELKKLAKDAFRVAAQAIIEQIIYAKMPPYLKKSINQARLENGTYEQIVSRLERELEVNGLEAPDEMPINTVTQQAPQQNANKPRPTCHHCKKPGHYQNQCRQLKREKGQTRSNMNFANNNNGSAQTNSNPNNNNNNKVVNNTKGSNINNQRDRGTRPVFHPVRHVVELTTPQRNAILEQTQRTDRLHEIDDRRDRTRVSRIMLKVTQMEMSRLLPKL